MERKVYWIEGDGIGPDVWKAARPVIDAAVRHSYGDSRRLVWEELIAGEKALRESGELLPEATLSALRGADLAIKGPLGTPVGTGFRSLNVTLRQTLDLYACIRPIHAFPGVASPVKHPEKVNMIVFRENTEDVYAGIEYGAGTPEVRRLIAFLREELGADVDESAAVGVKPMSARASRRLIRAAIEHALKEKLPSVTLVHKGNIMKYTEGAFRQCGYDLAAEEFAGSTVSEAELKKSGAPTGQAPAGQAPAGQAPAGQRVIIKDRIADAMFQEARLHPEAYSVLAAPNLNGDYLSDALAAQVGGLGLAPGLNRSDRLAFFEATHGTAPTLAGKDRANPGSLVLCGGLLLAHIGWTEAAAALDNAMKRTLQGGALTEDLAAQSPGARTVGCSAFGDLLLAELERS